MEKELFKKLLYSLIALLTAGNLYFIKNLVDKVESIEKIVWQLRQDVVVLTVRMDQKFTQND